MRYQLNRRVIFTLALVVASSAAVLGAQWPTGQILELLNRASLHRVIEGDPPVTTGLDDALTGIDFLDHFSPSRFTPLGAQRQDAAGGFHVGPGAYDFVAESYCLHPGTHGPGGGDGYLSAPLMGPRSDAVRHILQNAVGHSEIAQQDIQVLLWAILARSRISDMPRKTQLTAARLLTPEQLLELEGGALGLLSDRMIREHSQSLPLAARRAFEAEAGFRQILSRVDSSFDEIERFAVLRGDPASDPASREIPQGRWSYHSDGYFIRFFPSGYASTGVQVYVPAPMTLVRDNAGRIASIADERGRRLDVGHVSLAQLRGRLEDAALDAAGNGDADSRSPGLEFVTSAWAAVRCEQARECVSGMRTVDLSETVAVPGSRGRQRLGLSGRSQR